MKTQEVYVADDGSFHTDLADAERVNARMELWIWADDNGLCRGGEWSEDMVVELMIHHAEELAGILLKIKV